MIIAALLLNILPMACQPTGDKVPNDLSVIEFATQVTDIKLTLRSYKSNPYSYLCYPNIYNAGLILPSPPCDITSTLYEDCVSDAYDEYFAGRAAAFFDACSASNTAFDDYSNCNDIADSDSDFCRALCAAVYDTNSFEYYDCIELCVYDYYEDAQVCHVAFEDEIDSVLSQLNEDLTTAMDKLLEDLDICCHE